MSVNLKMKMTQAQWIQRDLACVWHPCSQMKDYEHSPMLPIKRGLGVYLEDFNGRRYLDAISSWWVNLFGHANPRINAALHEQLQALEHVMLAGFTHQPAIELAERLCDLAPTGLTRCFYADNGSGAIEVALKMSYHYWRNCDQPNKTRFVSLENGYHGETLGALAVGNVSLYKETYKPLLLEVITAPSPDCYNRESGESWKDYSLRQFAAMETLLQNQNETICAVVVEPLVQCAGGMRMYHPIYLQKLRAACTQYKVHLIADEVAVGFGRTGTFFASEQAHITPDFMCLSKGLTGGYLPLSTVLTNNEIYQAFYDDFHTLRAFLHSHSYTGNALACKAALATLDIFTANDTINKNKSIAKQMWESVQDLQDHPQVGEVRQTGMIVAIELAKDKATKEAYPWQERRGQRVYHYGLEHGMLLRPLGDVIYWMPPYIITPQQIAELAAVTKAGIEVAIRD